MSFEDNNNKQIRFSQLLYVKRNKKNSNGSHKITRIISNYPLQYKYNKLLYKKKRQSGRCNNGKLTVFSKGPVSKKRLPLINYNFRQKSLYFIGGLNYTNSFSNKFSSIVFTSEGSIFYKPLSTTDSIFMLTKLKSLNKTTNILLKKFVLLNPLLGINKKYFILLQQEKNSPISFLESKFNKGSKYTRSLGSSSKLIKLDTRTGYGLVTLSSSLKKVFSIFSLAEEGSANLSIPTKTLVSNKSGDKRKLGIKSRVRGVAKNPVDHPHGGRTKTIKSPKTPWGKVTKYK